MTKKIIYIIVAIIILAIAYFLLSPFWRNVTLDESLPGSNQELTTTDSVVPVENTGTSSPMIKDNMLTMDATTKINFEKKTTEMKNDVMVKTEVMPSNQPAVISKENLIARAHEVEGSASIVKSGSETFLRFENLKTINGPDLRIYLSSDLSADDIVDLGPIRATQGNVNYTIPAGTDLTKYKNVMIWCRAFGVLFSYAQFK